MGRTKKAVHQRAVKAAERFAAEATHYGGTHEQIARAIEHGTHNAEVCCGDVPEVQAALGGWREVGSRYASTSRVATAAYRTGWDRAFTKKAAQA